MSNFNQMRQGLHEGLRASTRIDLRRAVVAHADAPPGHETTEQQLKDISIACAGLDTPLNSRSGNGGEVIALEEEMTFDTPGLYDALTQRPSVLEAVASRERLDVLTQADAISLGVDLAQSVNADSSLEKLLAHQIAASHRLAMRFMGMSHDELQGYKTYGQLERSVEASRSASSASRLMAACSASALVLQRLQQSRADQRPTSRVSVNITSITKENLK